MISIKFDYLGLHPESIPIIAQWHQDQWQHISPDLTTQRRIKLYSTYTNTPDIPSCLLALVDNRAAGSASLVASDMDSHPHLGPWLASVYVHPDFRRRGIATQLIEKILQTARQTGVKTLYLFTPDQLNFYQKRGWKLIESGLYHGENIDIMAFDLNTI